MLFPAEMQAIDKSKYAALGTNSVSHTHHFWGFFGEKTHMGLFFSSLHWIHTQIRQTVTEAMQLTKDISSTQILQKHLSLSTRSEFSVIIFKNTSLLILQTEKRY